MAVQYWYPLYDNESTRESNDVGWIPVTAALVDCVIKSLTAAPADVGPLKDSDYFCHLIQEAGGVSSKFISISEFMNTDGDPSEASNDSYASFTLDTFGASYVEFLFDKSGAASGVGSGDAVTMNCLFMEI